jgi:ribosomal protein S12 methylthiotransferase
MLKRMNRRATKGEILGLIEKLRRRIKGLAIRTSIIVGFPGETEGEFRELLDFVRESRFERLGAFLYSREEGTRACDLSDQIPEKEKRLRLDELMKLQRDISEKMNASFVGKELTVLVDERCEGPDGRFVGRGESDAPEVDGAVHIKAGGGVRVGEFARVRITGALEYDLVGEAAR